MLASKFLSRFNNLTKNVSYQSNSIKWRVWTTKNTLVLKFIRNSYAKPFVKWVWSVRRNVPFRVYNTTGRWRWRWSNKMKLKLEMWIMRNFKKKRDYNNDATYHILMCVLLWHFLSKYYVRFSCLLFTIIIRTLSLYIVQFNMYLLLSALRLVMPYNLISSKHHSAMN